jgi:intraflagellar transport protein 81
MAVQQVKEIVDRLNAEPFWCDLSLVVFDEKEPFELMEILKKVLVYLDSKHDMDMREEKPDAMYQRVSEFLYILGYQCSFDIEFQQGLMSGDKHTVHPILYWLLSNLEQLRKRAYLAKFCVNLEVPEEFLREEQVYEIFQQYKELQGQFKATHAHVETARQDRMNPSDLQREVTQLDSEREQLSQKIQQLRTKSEREEGFKALLEVTSMLRKEQEEEARLGEKLHEQRYQLE